MVQVDSRREPGDVLGWQSRLVPVLSGIRISADDESTDGSLVLRHE